MTPAEQSFARQIHLASAETAEPGFLRAIRGEGREVFLREKFPTVKHEDWRFTSLAPLVGEPFAPAPLAQEAPADLPAAPRLVFLNGLLDRSMSDLSGLSPGVECGSLAAALRERPAAIEPHLGRIARTGARSFLALNGALFRDGALVELRDGAICEETISLVFIAGETGAAPVASMHPRNLIVAGRGARATIAEHYRGRGRYLVNAVTELSLADGAEVEHDRIQEEASGAFHLGLLDATLGSASRLVGQSIALGGRLARVEGRVLLGGEGASCDLNGLYVAGGAQLVDHFLWVDHAVPGCTSRQRFKGILDGSSRGVFAGRIHVRQGAQKTDAGQTNSNLLLSDDATVDAKPQLEIYADDVKCSHGGTVGQLREDQLFYLRSRGVSEPLARALLTWAFASELVERIAPEPLRVRVRRAVTARLPHGALLREVA